MSSFSKKEISHCAALAVALDLRPISFTENKNGLSQFEGLLPTGFNLVQEVENRFVSTYLVVERFLKSASHVQEILASKDSMPAKNAFASLQQASHPCVLFLFPALEVITDVFHDIVELQKKMESSTAPTIHLALPELQICMDKLSSFANGGSVYRGRTRCFVPASQYSRRLCSSIAEWLEAKVRIHPLLMAGCFLNPLFRDFHFLRDVNKRTAYRNGAESLIRSIISAQDDQTPPTTPMCEEYCSATVVNDPNCQPPVAGRKRTYSLLSYADSFFQPVTPQDEVSRDNHMEISQLPIDREKYIHDSFGPVRFWHLHRSTFPKIYKAALRLFAIPLSSCASERVFSAVKRIVSNDCTSITSSELEEIIVVRSLTSNN